VFCPGVRAVDLEIYGCATGSPGLIEDCIEQILPDASVSLLRDNEKLVKPPRLAAML